MLVSLLLAGAASIPFVFESQSIRYKLGWDKTLLRTGKMLGMMAATLLLLQLVLSARMKLLDRIFGLNTLYIAHRVNAVLIVIAALLHPLLVFAPEDITSLPLELKFWPEILGAMLLLAVWTITATGLWRRFLDLPFHFWRIAHRAATFTVVVLLFVHVLFVSDTFEHGLPRRIVLITAVAYAVVFCWVKLKSFLHARKPYVVASVTQAARNTYAVTLASRPGAIFHYLPGQFAFVSFQSNGLTAEEHPFTISSTPTRPDTLQFIIHCSGDWTGRIGHLRPGDTAIVDGPYGLFSHLARTRQQELVMIAGGIGITPMLSMLRYMADVNDPRKTTLVWSNRTWADKVYEEECSELALRLPGLKIIDLFTRQDPKQAAKRRLDRMKLENFLADCDRQAVVFICGPPTMMCEMRQIMLRIGFKRRFINTEAFAL